MTYPLNHFDWQALRMLVRGGNAPLTGRQLRHCPNRYSKDGSFLVRLVAAGLLEVVGVDPKPTPRPGAMPDRSPVQFRTRYRLTEKGLRAAEYGCYEKALPTQAKKPATLTK